MQKHGVQYRTCSGRDAEGDVGDPERGLYSRDLGLDAPDALDRLHGRGPPLLIAGCQREGQASKISNSGSSPCSSQHSSRCARRSRPCAAVLAMPTSSIVSAISAAPCASATAPRGRACPRPPQVDRVDDRPARDLLEGHLITSGSVESIWIGAPGQRDFLATRRICSSSSLRSVSATHRSSTCAPPVTWSSAICTSPS